MIYTDPYLIDNQREPAINEGKIPYLYGTYDRIGRSHIGSSGRRNTASPMSDDSWRRDHRRRTTSPSRASRLSSRSASPSPAGEEERVAQRRCPSLTRDRDPFILKTKMDKIEALDNLLYSSPQQPEVPTRAVEILVSRDLLVVRLECISIERTYVNMWKS